LNLHPESSNSFLQAAARHHKGFTLVEILIAVAVLLFLVSIATIGYQALLDNAREAVCTTNVKALTTAVEAYAMENDVIPAVLGDLELRHLEKAYAQVLEESDWFAKFAQHAVNFSLPREAYAERFLTYKNLRQFGVSKKIFQCPADEDGGVSYGINAQFAMKRWDEIDDDAILVGDCDSPTFVNENDLKKRHRGKTTAVGSTKNKEVKKTTKNKDTDKNKDKNK
jgi:prepilin-type N-terminal cleavage/methylation domain-containing protein